MDSTALNYCLKILHLPYMSVSFLSMNTTTLGQLACSCFHIINLLLVYTSLKLEMYLLLQYYHENLYPVSNYLEENFRQHFLKQQFS